MSNGQYPPGGVLFHNNKKNTDKAPDFTGNIEIDADLLMELQAQLQANPRAKLDLAGWRKMSNGKEFISLRLSRLYKGAATQPQGQGGQQSNNTQGGSQGGSQGGQRQDNYQAPPSMDDEIPFSPYPWCLV